MPLNKGSQRVVETAAPLRFCLPCWRRYTLQEVSIKMKIANSGMIFAIASMVFMGISTFIYKKSTDSIGATNTTFFYYLFSIIIATAVWLVFKEDKEYSYQSLAWPIAIAICLFLSVWFFNLALRDINISTAATIRSLFFVVTVLLAIVVAKEQPGPLGYAGIGLAIASVILLAFNQRSG